MAGKKHSSSSNTFSNSKRTSKLKSPYAASANVLGQILEDKRSFKNVIYAKDGTLKCTKTTYAQVCQVLSHKSILEQILERVPRLSKEVHDTGLLLVLVYELLLGPNKAIRGGGSVKRKILHHQAALQKALALKSIAQQLQEQNHHKIFPRYARVNTLLISIDEICSDLQKAAEKDSETLEFYMDPHVPDLLVFPPSIIAQVMAKETETEKQSTKDESPLFHQFESIKSWMHSGKLVLQDKSSCFSAFCLAHGFSQEHDNMTAKDYMDACAAPGNKTQHLAALLGQHGNNKQSKTSTESIVYAMDRSTERLASLARRMNQLVPKDCHVQVTPEAKDFLQLKPADYVAVGAILLDPSCSGSGIYNAPDRWAESAASDEEEHKRIDNLAKFQELALVHAMSFPSVSRIVYSTCSLHDRENEQVVIHALAKIKENRSHDEKDNNGVSGDKQKQWKIVAPSCLSSWKRRGHVMDGLNEQEASCMIRACHKDETNGFFVCCLERSTGTKDLQKNANSKASIVMHAPKGVPIYQGQFAQIISQKDSIDDCRAEDGKNSIRNNNYNKEFDPRESPGKNQNRKDDTKQDSNEKSFPKKVAKKLAWKKRQMEQKQKRLEKQKAKKSKHSTQEER